MNYQDTIQWMFSRLPMYQNKGKAAYKADLSNTHKLSDYLQHPETGFRSIHIAGTNGKGSVSHMIASILQEAGYKVGLYTSPHLKDFRERIKINGRCISKQFVIQFIKRHKAFFESNSLSFFEMTVGMAFEYFKKKQVDIAVIEVGLGGRLDSTNIILPEVSVITNIGLDHTQFLGNTVEQIAVEKAGIIKEGVPVVIGQTQEETTTIFRRMAAERHSDISFADQAVEDTYDSDLKGHYQKHNIKTAVQAIWSLKKQGFKVNETQIRKGLRHVVTNTGLLGRWQILQEHPKVICDTAHNREGLTLVMEQLQEETYETLHMVIGMVNDKDLASIISLFPKNALYYFCKPDIQRGLDASILKRDFEAQGYQGKAYNSVEEAYQNARKQAEKQDLIYVGGSTFVVAEII